MRISAIHCWLISACFFLCIQGHCQNKDSAGIVCKDTILCTVENNDNYNYGGQSISTSLRTGDSVKITFIAYAGHDFRVFACGDNQLGSLSFKISEPVRTISSKISKINENEEIIYKLDEFGEQVFGSDDKPVILSKEIIRDTIWNKNVNTNETIIFNSSDSGSKFWESQKQQKTKRLIVTIYSHASTGNNYGCCTLMIGRRYTDPFRISK